MLSSRRWWLSRKNCYGRWNLGPLPPAGNQESEQEMAPYLLTKTEKKNPHTTSCGEYYADSLLGWTRGNFGTLNAQGVTLWPVQCMGSNKESHASCNQVQMTWKSEYRCFAPTWQYSAPYCPFNCCNDPRSVLRVSSTFALHSRPRPPMTFMSLDRSKKRWEASLSGPAKWISRRCTSGCSLSQNNLFVEVSMHFRSAGTLVRNAMETT